VPGAVAAATRREATTDDGRSFPAARVGATLIGGAPEEALAAARYWELPPSYVARLTSALAVSDEDPSDGN
jgi:hypothetical protein